MSIDSISHSIPQYQPTVLPEEVWQIIYEFLNSENLTQYAASKTSASSINDYLSFKFGLEAIRASQITNLYERSNRLHELANRHASTTYDVVEATADQIDVDYLQVEYLSEVGKALATKGKIEAAKKVFLAASEKAQSIESYYIRTLAFKDLGKCQLVSGDRAGANISFTKAEEAAEQEPTYYIKAQLKARIDQAKQ